MKRSPMPQRTTPLARTQLRSNPRVRGALPVPPTPDRAPSEATTLKRTKLRPVSKKRAKANRERTEMLRPARLDPQICAVPWCDQVGDSPHEPLTRARGGSITDPDNVVMICWPHNQELTEEPAWGYELGFLRHSWDGAA